MLKDNKLKKFKILISSFYNAAQSDFLKNVSKLMTGTVLSQILPLLVAPILSRIYLPSDYGLLGLYMSVTGMVSMLATLQYASAIVIAKDDEETKKVVKLCLNILTVFSAGSLVLIFFFRYAVANYLNTSSLSSWLWLMPISIFMTGLSTIFSNYAIRCKYYSLLASNRVFSSVFSTLFSLILGYLTHNVIGLFAGLLVGQFSSGLFLAIGSLNKSKDRLVVILESDIAGILKKYINFPKYSLFADFVNNFTNQLPIFMLNGYGTINAVGSYNMSNRLLGLPIGFLSNSIGEVFRQRAAQDYNTFGNCKYIFTKTLKTLAVLSVVPFFVIIFFGEDIFAIVLGERWREAGVYAQIMGVMFLFRFIVSPLTYVYTIGNRLKEDFYLHTLFLVLGFLSFYVGYELFKSTYYSLIIFSILYSLIYVVYLIRSYQISMGVIK